MILESNNFPRFPNFCSISHTKPVYAGKISVIITNVRISRTIALVPPLRGLDAEGGLGVVAGLQLSVLPEKLLVGTTPSLPFGQPAPSKGARGSLSSWAGSVDALPGEKLPGDARGTSRRAAAPNLKQSGCGAAAWTSTACSPAPNAAQSVVKKRLLVPFPRTEKEPAGGMTRYVLLPRVPTKGERITTR